MHIPTRPVAIAAAVWLLLAGVSFAGDDLLPQVERGRKAIESGDFQGAIDVFQGLIQALQTRVSAAMERYFPDVGGWSAGEIRSQSWAGTSDETSQSMTNLTREYVRDSDGARCSVNMTNWPTVGQTIRQTVEMNKQMQSMIKSDDTMQMSFDSRDAWSIMTIINKRAQQTQAYVVSDAITFIVELDRTEKATIDSFIKAFDLDGLTPKSN